MKRITVLWALIAGLMAALCGTVAALAPAIAQSAPHATPQVLGAKGTAAIDGVDSPGEWNAAARLQFEVKDPSGAVRPASFLVMNDTTNLYLAFQISTPDPSEDNNSVWIGFDNNADGLQQEGEDFVAAWALDGFLDQYFTTKPPCNGSCIVADTDTAGTNDGAGAATNNGSFTFFEISHPLDSADDTHDFSLQRGDAVGIWRGSFVMLCRGRSHDCSTSSISEPPLYIVIAPFAPPTISSFEPATAPVGGLVEIEGSHFIGATAVTFGGVAASFNIERDAVITATVPAGAKTGRIEVTTPGGTATGRSPFVIAGMKAVISAPFTTPKKLIAGINATVSFKVTRSDTGAQLTAATMICDPSIAGRVLAHRERFANGTARLQFHIPAAAKGKLLRVHLTIRWQGTTAMRNSSFRLRQRGH